MLAHGLPAQVPNSWILTTRGTGFCGNLTTPFGYVRWPSLANVASSEAHELFGVRAMATCGLGAREGPSQSLDARTRAFGVSQRLVTAFTTSSGRLRRRWH